MSTRQRPGARGRIGIIQPAPGVMLEHEWPRWLPADVLFPIARVRMTSATPEGYAQLAAAAPAAAADLASAGADVVAYACGIGSLFAGADAEARLIGALEAAAGRPALSLATASVAALRAVGARRLAIMTPYAPETNRWVESYIVSQGFDVAGFVPTPVGIATVGDMGAAEVATVAVSGMMRLPDADALWIPCTAIQTMDAIAAIEAGSGRPAVSGSQALMWRALGTIGADGPGSGAGRLFAAC